MNAFKILFLLFIGAVALIPFGLSCSGDGDDTGPPANYSHYLPLNVGNKWVYDYAFYPEGPSGGPASETAEYIYEVTAVIPFQGYDAFEVRVSRDGVEETKLYFRYAAGKCLRWDGDSWAYVISDYARPGDNGDIGFLSPAALTYYGLETKEVPAGEFENCMLWYVPAPPGYTPVVGEYYAADVGSVSYHEDYDGYDVKVYELTSYTVNPPPSD